MNKMFKCNENLSIERARGNETARMHPISIGCGLASGDWRDGRGGWVGCVDHVVLWGGLKDLMQEKNEERYVMIKVRPEG